MKTLPKEIKLVGLLGAIAVAFGAMGAHYLKNQVSTGLITADQVAGFDTGVKYHMYHTLAMLAVVMLSIQFQNKWLKRAYHFFSIGILLFSGSLYLLCTRNLWHLDWLSRLGPITPIGGLFFILGWLSLILAAVKKS